MQTIRIAINILKSKGIDATLARTHILAACIDQKMPLDASDIAALVGDKVHLATVYRTLEKLVAIGLLERIDFQEGKFRYEYVHDHHHTVCESCGKVEDIKDQGIAEIEKTVKKDTGFLVTKHVLEFFGMCQRCQTKGVV
jgi:Fur family transcriptional regulator, ferric uptake regulator